MKGAYFMTVIDDVFCVRGACRQTDMRHVSKVILDLSEIMGGYNTSDCVVRDRRIV